MRSLLVVAAVVLAGITAAGPALAEVLAEGRPSNGYYWQKVEYKDGSIRYLCRSTSEGKIQKHANCERAGARRP
jgi:hypothetical protein